ncbi:hypothetical protein K8I61_18490 [bacterium]|nr:hypothetical protein [bacterium]
MDRIRKIILDGEEVLKEKKKMQGLAKSSTSIEERRRLTEQARNLEEEYRNNRDDEEELDQQIMVAISEGNKLRVVAWCAWIARESLSSNSD